MLALYGRQSFIWVLSHVFPPFCFPLPLSPKRLPALNQKLKDREIKKFYLCVVHGTLKEKDGTLHGWLTKDEKKNLVKVFTRQTDGSKEIKTKYLFTGYCSFFS